MKPPDLQRWSWLHLTPLVPMAVAVTTGIALGSAWAGPVELALALAGIAWAGWVSAEIILQDRLQTWVAHACLLMAMVCGGVALWQLDQQYVERAALVRLLPEGGEVPVAVRARVVVPPKDEGPRHGNVFWVGEAQEVLTEAGWIKAAGDIRVKSQTGIALARGMLLQVHGWARRPEEAKNPGAFDLRRYLAGSRVFVEVRANKAGQVAILEPARGWGVGAGLSWMRTALREKLLEHTAREDGEAGNAMVALLLGYRDPSIEDVSQSFADAGVAHLLAISGSHVVFFAGICWALLRLVPMRPRVRLILVGMLVSAYVLATPCGPPVMRAGIAMLMIVAARLMARRASMLNMLAAALLGVVVLRPMDLFDAGCQLSFISTAGLILMGGRCYAAVNGKWLRRQGEIAVLSAARWPAWRLRGIKMLLGMLVANAIGSLTAAPLVAYHFGQGNPLAIVAGVVALPVVFGAMLAALVQLVATVVWGPLGALLAPVTAGMGRVMVWVVGLLAGLPGATVAVRSPAVWVVMVVYVVMLLWVMRRWLGVRRASVCLAGLAGVVLVVGWYGVTMPVGELRMEVLEVASGSAVVVRLPGGGVWVVNAGSQSMPGVMRAAVEPALRVEGVRRVGAVVVTGTDKVHAGALAEVVGRYRPGDLVASEAGVARRDWTLGGTEVFAAAERVGSRQVLVAAGNTVECEGVRVRVVWPPLGEAGGKWPAQAGLILRWEYAGRRVLMVDGSEEMAWGALVDAGADLRSDVVVLLGPGKEEAVGRLAAVTGGRVVRGGEVSSFKVQVSRTGEVRVGRR